MNKGLQNLSEVDAGGVHWHILPGWEARLLDPDGLRLQEWLDDGSAQIVKHGSHRTVYRIHLPDECLYVKHYRQADLRSRIRQMVRPAKARREFQCALAVAERDVPTVMPLALGERPYGPAAGESYLITKELEDVQPLSLFVEEALPLLPLEQQLLLRRRLAVDLGGFIARLHEAGVAHHDLHPANVMMRLGKDGSQLFLLDLDSVRLSAPLSWSASRDNLVILNRYFILRSNRSDRARFWRAYYQTRPAQDGWPRLADRKLAVQVEEQTERSNLDFWRRLDRRCCRNNRYYYRFRHGAFVGHAVADVPLPDLVKVIEDPESAFANPGVRVLKDSPTVKVALIPLDLGARGRLIILKRFGVRRWTDPLAGLVRPTPALRSWIHGHGLRERFLPTARPLAVWQRTTGGLCREAYLITEYIADAFDLRSWLQTLQQVSAPGRLRAEIERVARLVRVLHARRISHRDLKAGNILARQDGLWLIDLVGMRVHRRLGIRRRVQNLARLHASFHDLKVLSRADKLRFLRTYLCEELSGRQGWKPWWGAIAAATQSKVERNRRSGRPLA